MTSRGGRLPQLDFVHFAGRLASRNEDRAAYAGGLRPRRRINVALGRGTGERYISVDGAKAPTALQSTRWMLLQSNVRQPVTPKSAQIDFVQVCAERVQLDKVELRACSRIRRCAPGQIYQGCHSEARPRRGLLSHQRLQGRGIYRRVCWRADAGSPH